MKITLIVYGISWLILLCIFLYSKVKQKDTDLFNRNEWYLYLIIIAFAPLCILLIPYLLIEDCVKDRKARKQNIENEKKKKIAEGKKKGGEGERKLHRTAKPQNRGRSLQ